MSLQAVPLSPSMSVVDLRDPLLAYMLDQAETFDYEAYRERLQRQEALVSAYATADPVLMYSSYLHPVTLRASGETDRDYIERPKFARTLTSRVLDARMQGVSALPVKFEPSSSGFPVEPLTRPLDLEKIQTVAETSTTAVVRPYFDYVMGSIAYQIFGGHEVVPYVAQDGVTLLGISFERDGWSEHWTEASFAIFHKKELVKSGPNPFGEIPVGVVRMRKHPRLWWGVCDLGVVTLNNIAINKLWTDLIQLAAEQSFAIYVVYEDDDGGAEDDDEPVEFDDQASEVPARRSSSVWTSGNTVYVPKNGKVETLSPKADIKAIGETVEIMGARVLDDSYLIDVSKSQAGQSGFSLKVRQQPYLNKCRALRKTFGPGISDALAIAAVIDYAARNNLPYATRNRDFSIRADFDESPLTPIPVDEGIRRSEHELKIGASSVVDYVMRSQGVDRAEAIEIVRRVQAENGELGEGGTGADLNDLSLAAQRLGSIGDVDGVNLLRQKITEKIGAEGLSPLTEVARPSTR